GAVRSSDLVGSRRGDAHPHPRAEPGDPLRLLNRSTEDGGRRTEKTREPALNSLSSVLRPLIAKWAACRFFARWCCETSTRRRHPIRLSGVLSPFRPSWWMWHGI